MAIAILEIAGTIGDMTVAMTGKQFLEDEFGLRPLDCRLRRTMVRVTFSEDGEESTHCAQPTRAIPAGDYNYNARTKDLDSVTAEDLEIDAGCL